MNTYVTKEYIEESDIDRIIREDKELIEIIKEQNVDVKSDRIVFATITVILGIVKFILNCRPPRDLVSYRILDNKMSDVISNLVGDKNAKVYMLKSDVINAFNAGTPDVYYTDKFIKKLRISENELIGVCLHEYGHYAGRHGLKINITNTATGIVIPVLMREITREFHPAISYFLGKIVSLMVTTHLRIIMGRPQEYFSDSYAAKKGYGKYLVSALNKMEVYIRRVACKDKTESECDALMDAISEIDEHPKTKDRIDNILKSSKITSIISSGRFELLVRFLDRIKGFFGR